MLKDNVRGNALGVFFICAGARRVYAAHAPRAAGRKSSLPDIHDSYSESGGKQYEIG